MTEEEWERLKDSIRANLNSERDEAAEKARRKLDRDMDRLERALNACLNSEAVRQRRRDERKRWQEFDKRFKECLAKSSALAARTDEKLKAMKEEMDRRNPSP